MPAQPATLPSSRVLKMITFAELGFTSPEEVLKNITNKELLLSKGFHPLRPTSIYEDEHYTAVEKFIIASGHQTAYTVIWSQQDESCFYALRKYTQGEIFMPYIRFPESIRLTDHVVLQVAY